MKKYLFLTSLFLLSACTHSAGIGITNAGVGIGLSSGLHF